MIEYINNKYSGDVYAASTNNQLEQNTEAKYKMKINVTKYNAGRENEIYDLVKEVNVSVTYKIGSRNQTIEMKKTKTREVLETPNKPNLSLLEVDSGFTIYPLKYADKKWKICDKNDASWYDYLSGRWALALKTNKQYDINDNVNTNNISENEAIYAWLPRYAYDSTNSKILFLFSNTDKYIKNPDELNAYNSLENYDNTKYELPNEFSNQDSQKEGIWTTDSNINAYQYLNQVYPLKH